MNNPQFFSSLASLADFAVRINTNGMILQASESSQAFIDLSVSPAGEAINFLIHPEDLPILIKAKELASLSGKKQSLVCRLLRQRVIPVWVDCHILRLHGQDEFAFIAFDATHWKENEAKLAHLTTHDSLTGLPGRTLLEDSFKMAINTANQENQAFSLLILDVDGFK